MNPSRCGSCSRWGSIIIFGDDEMNDDDVGLTFLSAFKILARKLIVELGICL